MRLIIFLFLIFTSCKESAHHHEEHHDHKKHEDHDKHDEHHDHEKPKAEEEGHHHEEASNVGPNYAVIAADEHEGIQLSPAALKRTGIQTLPVNDDGSITIPHDCIVHEQKHTGIYRLRDGWFFLIPIEEEDHGLQFLKITSVDLRIGDQVVINGAGILRIAELNVFTEDVEGHAH